jgi:hypothetical protein
MIRQADDRVLCRLTGKLGTTVLPVPSLSNMRRVLWDGETEPVLQRLVLLARVPPPPQVKPPPRKPAYGKRRVKAAKRQETLQLR